MGVVVVFLAVIGFGVLFGFLSFPPPYAKQNVISTFNNMVLAVCGLLSLVAFLKVRLIFIHTDNAQWWLPASLAAALAIEIIMLAICFVIRNFWIFKPPRRPGSF